MYWGKIENNSALVAPFSYPIKCVHFSHSAIQLSSNRSTIVSNKHHTWTRMCACLSFSLSSVFLSFSPILTLFLSIYLSFALFIPCSAVRCISAWMIVYAQCWMEWNECQYIKCQDIYIVSSCVFRFALCTGPYFCCFFFILSVLVALILQWLLSLRCVCFFFCSFSLSSSPFSFFSLFFYVLSAVRHCIYCEWKKSKNYFFKSHHR